jgi:hypothetical protein
MQVDTQQGHACRVRLMHAPGTHEWVWWPCPWVGLLAAQGVMHGSAMQGVTHRLGCEGVMHADGCTQHCAMCHAGGRAMQGVVHTG